MTCKCCKCNEKIKFVVIEREEPCDVDVGELGFRLQYAYEGGPILVKLSNGQSLLRINQDGTFRRNHYIYPENGLKLDEYLRIKVSE